MTAEQTNEGDIFEVVDDDKPTGRLYICVPMDAATFHAGYIRAKQHNTKETHGITVDIGNKVTVRIIHKNAGK